MGWMESGSMWAGGGKGRLKSATLLAPHPTPAICRYATHTPSPNGWPNSLSPNCPESGPTQAPLQQGFPEQTAQRSQTGTRAGALGDYHFKGLRTAFSIYIKAQDIVES